jgi:hypothetical protein
VAAIDPLVGITALVGYLYSGVYRNMHTIKFSFGERHSTYLSVLLTRDALASINMDT